MRVLVQIPGLTIEYTVITFIIQTQVTSLYRASVLVSLYESASCPDYNKMCSSGKRKYGMLQ